MSSTAAAYRDVPYVVACIDTITDMAAGTNIQSTLRTLEGAYQILMVSTYRIPNHSGYVVSQRARDHVAEAPTIRERTLYSAFIN
jgi:hypothetical protein